MPKTEDGPATSRSWQPSKANRTIFRGFVIWQEKAYLFHFCQRKIWLSGLYCLPAQRGMEGGERVDVKITICEFPDEAARKKPAWDALVAHVDTEEPDLVVLPEMPFCEWIFGADTFDRGLW